MEKLWSREEDMTLYEDDRVAIELGNGKDGASLYVMDKVGGMRPDAIRRFMLADLLTEEAP